MMSTGISVVLGDPNSIVQRATITGRLVAPESPRPLATVTIGSGGMDLTITSHHPEALEALAAALEVQAGKLRGVQAEKVAQ